MALWKNWTVHELEVLDFTLSASKVLEVMERTFRSERKLEGCLWELDDITFM